MAFSTKIEVIKELLGFLWKEKLWWMVPIFVVLIFIGLLMVFAQGSAFAPFIYTLF